MSVAIPNHLQEAAAVRECIAAMNAQQTGNSQQALIHFTNAVKYAPKRVDLRIMLAYAHGAIGDVTGAEITLRVALEECVVERAQLRELADAAIELNANEVAQSTVLRLLSTSDNDADLHAALGALYHRCGNVADATTVLHRAFVRWPSHLPTLMNRARLLAETGEHAEALALYSEAVRLNPSHSGARWHLGLLQLLTGDFEAGWENHEHRRELPFMRSVTPTQLPALRREHVSQLVGKKVLLWGEQGLGDQIMGVRYAESLAQLGAEVTVRCAKPLEPLFKYADGVTRIVTSTSENTECDYHIPMLSVPYLLWNCSNELEVDKQYLQPPPQQYLRAIGSTPPHIQALFANAAIRSNEQRPTIAVAWAGSPGHGNDHNRSMPFDHLAALLSIIDATWISVQLGSRSAELRMLSSLTRDRIVDASEHIKDFNDTAHVLSGCHAVITVDTSVAHLGGALGVPTLSMLPFVPDWRWQLARRDTALYRSMRLVRQPMAGAWEHTVDDVIRAVNSGEIGSFRQ